MIFFPGFRPFLNFEETCQVLEADAPTKSMKSGLSSAHKSNPFIGETKVTVAAPQSSSRKAPMNQYANKDDWGRNSPATVLRCALLSGHCISVMMDK